MRSWSGEDVADSSQPELVVAVIWASVHVLMDLLLYVATPSPPPVADTRRSFLVKLNFR